MPEIVLTVQLAADPTDAFDAIATADGLRATWSDQVEARPEAGTVAEIRFGPEGETLYEMRIDTLDRPKLVAWTCLTAGLDEWPGTTVRWQFTPTPSGTSLRFEHLGWTSTEGKLGDCAYSWAMILNALDRYLTDGVPDPYFTHDGRG